MKVKYVPIKPQDEIEISHGNVVLLHDVPEDSPFLVVGTMSGQLMLIYLDNCHEQSGKGFNLYSDEFKGVKFVWKNLEEYYNGKSNNV